MENTQANRKLIARMTMDTFTPQELEAALLYELCERYKREPYLFDSVVVKLDAVEAQTKANAIEDEQRGDYVPTPDLEPTHYNCCHAPKDLGHMFGCPNSTENKGDEPNDYALCVHCGASHHMDEAHQCKGAG